MADLTKHLTIRLLQGWIDYLNRFEEVFLGPSAVDQLYAEIEEIQMLDACTPHASDCPDDAPRSARVERRRGSNLH